MFARGREWDTQPPAYALLRPELGITGAFLGSSLANLVTGERIAIGSAASLVATNAGMVLSHTNSTSSYGVLANNSDQLFPDNSRCTIAVLRRSRDTTARSSTLFGYNKGISGGANDRVSAHAPFSDGNLYWDFGTTGTGAGGGRVSVAFTKTTAWETLVFIADTQRGREVWRNGARIVGSTAQNVSRPANTDPFRIGGADGATSNSADNDDIALFVVSRYAWPPELIRRWSAIGRQYAETFEPIRVFLPLPTVGAGGFKPAWARGSNSIIVGGGL